MAALFMVMIDMVADPLSVLGERWFLGRIFWYDPPGPHFGVPISNYLGWYFVAAVTVAIFQWLDRRLNRGGAKPLGAVPAAISRAFWGPGLYAGIVGFAIVMLFRVGAAEIGWAGIFIFLPLMALTLHITTRAECWGDDAAVERHLADFPYERSLAVWNAAARRPSLGAGAPRNGRSHAHAFGRLSASSAAASAAVARLRLRIMRASPTSAADCAARSRGRKRPYFAVGPRQFRADDFLVDGVEHGAYASEAQANRWASAAMAALSISTASAPVLARAPRLATPSLRIRAAVRIDPVRTRADAPSARL